VYTHAGGEHFLIRDASHALGGYCNFMTAVGEGVRKVEHVPLLAASVRREELGEQEKAHQSALSAASTAVRYVNTIDAGDETQECFG
jgi:hypothetical protein